MRNEKYPLDLVTRTSLETLGKKEKISGRKEGRKGNGKEGKARDGMKEGRKEESKPARLVWVEV